MFPDPLKRSKQRTSAQVQLEVPIQTKLSAEMELMQIPVRWKRAKITARLEWEEWGAAGLGAIIQDMGYYPHGSFFFSNLRTLRSRCLPRLHRLWCFGSFIGTSLSGNLRFGFENRSY
jgi:hypothetical protein